MGGDSMFNAHERSGLTAYVAEVVSTDGGSMSPATYYSVAVTTKATCDAIGSGITLSSFKGRNACMTGYRRTAGWVLPMGYMFSRNIIPVMNSELNVEEDAESVATFFNRVCASGTAVDGPLVGGGAWTPLCASCKGNCGTSLEGEPYVDYEGSLRCLMEGSGDIAFMKHTTPMEYATDGSDRRPWSTLAMDDLRLVCPTGGCRPVSEWAECFLASAATHAFLGTKEFASSPDASAAIATLSGLNATAVAAAKALEPAQMLLTSSTLSLRRVADPSNFASHFGTNALAAFRAIRSLQAATARICTVSADEQAFCNQAVTLMNSKATGVTYSCVQKASPSECLTAIQNGEADMFSADGPDTYRGMVDHNLKAVMGEDYGLAGGGFGADYYAVAIVKKEFCDNTNGGNPTFRDLKGKKACSTGYRRGAGFTSPVGFLVNSGLAEIKRDLDNVQDDAETFAGFFSGGVCAARTSGNGPMTGADGRGMKWDPLCSACKGDCSNDITREPYYDYTGALRCVMEGAADVAFTKHTIATDYAKDGSTPQDWSTLNQADLRLLCPRGGCVPVTQAFQCHVATAPAHAVLVRTDYRFRNQLQTSLAALSADADFRALVFDTAKNSENYIFKASTVQLRPINDDTRTFLGSALAVYQGTDTLNSGGNLGAIVPLAAAPPSETKSGLAAGAVAGIAVGCIVGGALIAAAIASVVIKRKNKQNSDLNAVLSSGPVKV